MSQYDTYDETAKPGQEQLCPKWIPKAAREVVTETDVSSVFVNDIVGIIAKHEAASRAGVEPQTDTRPVSEAAQRAAEKIFEALKYGASRREREEVSAIIESELTKE